MPLVDNPLHCLHEQAEASFLPYGPLLQIVESYGAPEAEYAALRKGAALMDAPHRGVVELQGRDRLAFLQNLLTNDTQALAAGEGCYAYLLNAKGRIVLDANVLHLPERTLLEVDARRAEELSRLLETYRFSEAVRICNRSEQLGRLSLIGPRSAALLQTVADEPLEGLSKPFAVSTCRFAEVEAVLFRQDWCGEEQYELIVPRDGLVTLWQHFLASGEWGGGETGASTPRHAETKTEGGNKIACTALQSGEPARAAAQGRTYAEAGRHDDAKARRPGEPEPKTGNQKLKTDPSQPERGFGLRGIGWLAFNIARIEAGTPILDIDITAQNLPLETAHWYSRAVHPNKGCYLGQEVVARMHVRRTAVRMLVGLRLPAGAAPPLAGAELRQGAEPVGIVTSSCLSPMLGNVPIALGYLKTEFAAAGRSVLVYNRQGETMAVVTALPHWKRS